MGSTALITGVTSTALCIGAVDTGFVAAGDLEGADCQALTNRLS
jgi:hypothetical protein